MQPSMRYQLCASEPLQDGSMDKPRISAHNSGDSHMTNNALGMETGSKAVGTNIIVKDLPIHSLTHQLM